MKCTIPEISWHNRDPVLSVDIQPKCNENDTYQRIATGGTDSHVLIWHVTVQDNGAAVVEFAADLTRHQKAVNVVRFSPSGEFLASGDDESAIIIWKQRTELDCPEFPATEADGSREQWLTVKVLRGHVEDVYDLAWSPDSLGLVSGSVDNTAIVWDVLKGKKTGILTDHKGFVQGVAWDPLNQLVATLGSDRTCRVFNVHSKKTVNRTSRATLPVPADSPLDGLVLRLYHDDTFKSFFRRLCFSPDGQLLITPSGLIEETTSRHHSNATYIYTRKALNRPCVYLPSQDQFTIAVRCCPLLFELRDGDAPMFALPYRMVIAVAEQKSVVLYDTQQSEPFAIISNIHYTRLTDLTWSSDGRLLIISSTDGYCSVVTFAHQELGVIYKPSVDVTTAKEATTLTAPVDPPVPSPTSPEVKPARVSTIVPRKAPRSNEKTAKRIRPVAVIETSSVNVERPTKEVSEPATEEATTLTAPVDPLIPSPTSPEDKPARVATIVPRKAPRSNEETTKRIRPVAIIETSSVNVERPTEEVLELAGETAEVERARSPARCQPKSPGAPVTPVQGPRTPRRVAFTTLSSPKSKKKLL